MHPLAFNQARNSLKTNYKVQAEFQGDSRCFKANNNTAYLSIICINASLSPMRLDIRFYCDIYATLPVCAKGSYARLFIQTLILKTEMSIIFCYRILTQRINKATTGIWLVLSESKTHLLTYPQDCKSVSLLIPNTVAFKIQPWWSSMLLCIVHTDIRAHRWHAVSACRYYTIYFT